MVVVVVLVVVVELVVVVLVVVVVAAVVLMVVLVMWNARSGVASFVRTKRQPAQRSKAQDGRAGRRASVYQTTTHCMRRLGKLFSTSPRQQPVKRAATRTTTTAATAATTTTIPTTTTTTTDTQTTTNSAPVERQRTSRAALDLHAEAAHCQTVATVGVWEAAAWCVTVRGHNAAGRGRGRRLWWWWWWS